jgi:hypothetical protein
METPQRMRQSTSASSALLTVGMHVRRARRAAGAIIDRCAVLDHREARMASSKGSPAGSRRSRS